MLNTKKRMAAVLAGTMLAASVLTGCDNGKLDETLSTARQYLAEENYEQAVIEYGNALDIDSENPDAYIGLANAYIGLGMDKLALSELEKGYSLTEDTNIANMIAKLKAEMGVSDEQQGGSAEENTGINLSFATGTSLRMAVGHNAKSGLFFHKDVAGSNGVTLADGNTYKTGDLKPTWVEVENLLGVKFEDTYTGESSDNEWRVWEDKLEEVDFVCGTASTLTRNGDKLVNIANYLEVMPNFKAYLEANPIVRMSITGETEGENKGAIYFSPYFDGVNDIERMPLMRTDWVEKLLDGDGEFAATESGTTAAPVYTPYMPTTGSISVSVVKADGTGVEQLQKNYDAYGNIITKMNEQGAMSGVDAVNMLREYIDKTYNGYYGQKRSDLFVGQNAAWDADELVALLRCVCSNAQTLNGTDTVYGLFTRDDSTNQRRSDMMRLAGVLFGVRGLESRNEYFYFGVDGKLHDARGEKSTFEAMERMNCMAQEGLMSQTFMNGTQTSSKNILQNDLGFMHYDYNQTQTIFNENGVLDSDNGEAYMAVMIPVANWNDGDSTTSEYMRFTESWRSVKNDGWAISKAGVGLTEDKKVTTQAEVDALPDKLKACLKLIDYAYSKDGQVLMSYGPKAFRSEDTFNFNGEDWPLIADAAYAELWEKENGNYTNYARYYLGSTLSFVKNQAFEYQCTTYIGKRGAGYISKGIELGVIRHPRLSVESNLWWTSVPAVLSDNGATAGEFSNKFSAANGNVNKLVEIIANGYSGEGTTNLEETVNNVCTTWGLNDYLAAKNGAWDKLVVYYNEIK